MDRVEQFYIWIESTSRLLAEEKDFSRGKLANETLPLPLRSEKIVGNGENTNHENSRTNRRDSQCSRLQSPRFVIETSGPLDLSILPVDPRLSIRNLEARRRHRQLQRGKRKLDDAKKSL